MQHPRLSSGKLVKAAMNETVPKVCMANFFTPQELKRVWSQMHLLRTQNPPNSFLVLEPQLEL